MNQSFSLMPTFKSTTKRLFGFVFTMGGTIPLVLALPHKLPELIREPVKVPIIQEPPAKSAAAPMRVDPPSVI